MARGLMSDKEWAYFEPFVTETGPKRGRPASNHRLVLDGVFWMARTGAPWRDLPEEFGKWGLGLPAVPALVGGRVMGCLAGGTQCNGCGAEQRTNDRLHHRPRPSARIGLKRGAHQESIGRSRGGQTTKVHLRTNSIGLPIAITLSSGEASDYKGYDPPDARALGLSPAS